MYQFIAVGSGSYYLNMATIHISEADAARDFPGLMERVRAGEEVLIDDVSPAVKLSVVPARAGRSLSESIALAKAHAEKLGYEPVMDAEFAADMEEIIRKRKPRDTSAWD
jgi:antitoxin (DNA-binding transcriptional repressor) of toxin-antitoxin stability system